MIEYKNISNVSKFKKYATYLLGGYGNYLSKHKEIYKNEKLIGYIAFDEYEGFPDDDFDNALGIGDFMILDRNKGYGTEVINDIVKKNKNKYDLIYTYVDYKNTKAIKFYKRLGKVYDKTPNDNKEYYVVLWKRKN